MSKATGLIRQQRFLPFFLTQFLGAFNDNFYKNALVILLTYHAAQYTSLSAGVLVNLCAGIFILPFFLFSATAGQLADKLEKSRLMRLTKVLEIIIMGIAALAFALSSLTLMLSALFLLGTQSALFGPVKYAYLPQVLKEDELVGGNALVEAGSFIAILLGTIIGAQVIEFEHGQLWISVLGIVFAVAGYLSSRGVPFTAAASPRLGINWNPLTSTIQTVARVYRQHSVFLAILGISWFWFYGAVFLAQFPAYAKDTLGGGVHTITLLLAVFSIGIGIGSMCCEKLSSGRIELGLVPFGSIGLTLFGIDLWFASPSGVAPQAEFSILLSQPYMWRILFDLLLIGIFGGFYIVPLYTLMQTRSAAEERSRVIAANNILNALFMVIAAGMGAGLSALGLSVAQIFLISALINAVVAIYIYTLLPEFLLRFVVWILVKTTCRITIRHIEHLPENKPALLLCRSNHWLHKLLIMAASRHSLFLVLPESVLRLPLLGRLLRRCKSIAQNSGTDTEAAQVTADAIRNRLAHGGQVAYFIAEDADITHSLSDNPVLRLLREQISAPLIPVKIFSDKPSRHGRFVIDCAAPL